MADTENKSNDPNVLSRLAGRGEDAVTKLMDELGKNPRVTEALSKAMDAKGKVDTTTRRTLGQVGLAAADEIREMRGRLEKLEKRLSQLEGGGETAGRSGRKAATSTKSSGGTAKKTTSTRAKSSTGKASSTRSSSAKSGGKSSSSKASGGSGSGGSSGSSSSGSGS